MSIVAAILARRNSDRSVKRSGEFRRIEELPRRTAYPDMREFFTNMLGKPGCKRPLNLAQAWLLYEAYECKGAVGSLPVGAGKSLSSYLLPIVMESRRPLLLLPASLRDKTLDITIPDWSKDYEMHPNLKLLSYEQFSQEKQADILERLMPDLIIADECQKLANQRNAAWRRIERYYEAYPMQKVFDSDGGVICEYPTMFVPMSGSLTKRSLRNYAHLLKLALRQGSPLPHRYIDLEDWADALDEGIDEHLRPSPGALLGFCNENEPVRSGFRRRLIETKGFVSVADSDTDVDASLVINPLRHVEIPKEIRDAFQLMRKSGKTPTGEILASGLEVAAHARELTAGFFYKWKWKNDVVDYEWLAARKMWKKFVRQAIKASGTGRVDGQLFDTELQVAKACSAGRLICPKDEYKNWVAIRDRSDPETEPVWISEFLIDHIENWYKKENTKGKVGICWVAHKAVLDKCRERGMRVYGGGEDEINYETKTCVASIASHSTGKDLQAFNNNLFIGIPGGGTAWEQALGRTHRRGQEADEVNVELVLSCAELMGAFMQALRDAKYIHETMGQKQKLQYADLLADYDKLEQVFIQRASASPPDPLWVVDWPDKDEEAI